MSRYASPSAICVRLYRRPRHKAAKATINQHTQSFSTRRDSYISAVAHWHVMIPLSLILCKARPPKHMNHGFSSSQKQHRKNIAEDNLFKLFLSTLIALIFIYLTLCVLPLFLFSVRSVCCVKQFMCAMHL